MGKVEFVQRLGLFSVGAYPWEGEDGFQFRMGEDTGLGETVHPLSYFKKHPAAGGDLLL